MLATGDHRDTQRDYGSDQAKLVYAKAKDGSIVHISQVAGGLKCGCTCPGIGCDAPLVARKGHRTPHFAHYGGNGEACSTAPETALHLLAKEIIKENQRLVVPERVAEHGTSKKTLGEAVEVSLDEVVDEFRGIDGFIPDIFVTVIRNEKKHNLIVEVVVTHACDDEKIAKIAKTGIAAVEIDLSGIPRNAPRQEVEKAVLEEAPRRWIFHSAIADARQGLQEAELEAERRLVSTAQEKLEEYRRVVAEIGEKDFVIPHNDVLVDGNLQDHVGIAVNGYACFTGAPADWQTVILDDVLYSQKLGKRSVQPVAANEYLQRLGLIRRPFLGMAKAVEEKMGALDSSFMPPWRAVKAYLDYLVQTGVAYSVWNGFVMNHELVATITKLRVEREGRAFRIWTISEDVKKIVEHIPEGERNGFSVERWLDSIEPETGSTRRANLQDDANLDHVEAQIHSIHRVLGGWRGSVADYLGLPVQGILERRLAEIDAEDARKKEAAAQERWEDITARAKEVFIEDSDLIPWLNTPLSDLGGMSPLAAAAQGTAGQYKVQKLVNDIASKRRAQARLDEEAAIYRQKITDAAESRLGKEAKSFLNSRDDELNRMTPLLYCTDHRRYETSLKRLDVWVRGFS